jgi:hypothetical protein
MDIAYFNTFTAKQSIIKCQGIKPEHKKQGIFNAVNIKAYALNGKPLFGRECVKALCWHFYGEKMTNHRQSKSGQPTDI